MKTDARIGELLGTAGLHGLKQDLARIIESWGGTLPRIPPQE